MQLKGLVLVSELARHSGYHLSRYSKGQFAGKTVNIDGDNYLPKIYLTSKRDKEALEKCTNLDDYLTVGYCARYLLGLSPQYIRNKLKFQQKTTQRIYDFMKVQGVYYLKIPELLQKKIKKGVTYAVTDYRRFEDFQEVRDSYIFGDDLIVFM